MTAPTRTIASTILLLDQSAGSRGVSRATESDLDRRMPVADLSTAGVQSADPLVDRQTLRRRETRAKTNLPSGRRDPAQPVPTQGPFRLRPVRPHCGLSSQTLVLSGHLEGNVRIYVDTVAGAQRQAFRRDDDALSSKRASVSFNPDCEISMMLAGSSCRRPDGAVADVYQSLSREVTYTVRKTHPPSTRCVHGVMRQSPAVQ